MKVLTATARSQGSRDRDQWLGCVECELVRPIEERCAGAADCSCETAFFGLASRGLTTTAVVRDFPMLGFEDYVAALRDSLTVRERSFIVVERYAEELLRVAEGLPERAVLERWDEWIGCRFDPDTSDLRPDVATIAELDPAELEAAEIEAAELEALQLDARPGPDGDAFA